MRTAVDTHAVEYSDRRAPICPVGSFTLMAVRKRGSANAVGLAHSSFEEAHRYRSTANTLPHVAASFLCNLTARRHPRLTHCQSQVGRSKHLRNVQSSSRRFPIYPVDCVRWIGSSSRFTVTTQQSLTTHISALQRHLPNS